ncbi:amidohydrolase family protein [Arthrobacter globiformis]|uniref:amidohydrolase family protein n=1 Tax=Arthrobacter globiformis TaxID=1665 RepID=UPI0027925581|nr:amidohydrolase family protein [Arthrobacter globiformis]MDQ0618762.1 putative TIM-barrel fold metal-dependent hydrolase [Arthrobacter globiformis]
MTDANSRSVDLPLIDHHSHGVVETELSDDEFRSLATESDWPGPAGTDSLDSPFGLTVRRFCAPILGLEPLAPLDEYLARRRSIGAAEANRLLLRSTGTSDYLLDTGIPDTRLLGPAAMAARAEARTREIVRIERVAEDLASESTAAGFVAKLPATLAARSRDAVGLKSIIAYRHGFDIPAERPSGREVLKAADEWFRTAERTGTFRVTDPVLLRFGLWSGIDAALPIQLHTGYGDGDIELFRADPSRLNPLFHATRSRGVDFMLLHCYPFIREAGILAQVFPHVYLDVGLVSHYLGPSAGTAIRQSMEVAPFSKVLYSSDSYGLGEHYAVSAAIWRSEFVALMDDWVASGWATPNHAERIAAMVASKNARRVYNLKA